MSRLNQNEKIGSPRYLQIAAAIASKIADRQYLVGEKIYASSSLASQYKVSSETARRAICVLADLDIVESEKGSGVKIKSYENALKYMQQIQDVDTIVDIKDKLLVEIEEQNQINHKMKDHLLQLIDKADRFKDVNPFVPYQFLIEEGMEHVGQSLAETNFWHQTSATIIGIKRNQEIVMSPGPYATLLPKDTLYFVGDEQCIEKVKRFFNN